MKLCFFLHFSKKTSEIYFISMKKNSFKRYTITAALPYANGPIHIGHLAGVYIPADVFARYLRKKEKEVLFICGSDEHGVAISLKAKKEGLSPQELIDKYHHILKNSLERFNISFDHYSRTSSEIHHNTSKDFFSKLYTQNDFIEKTSEQYYDESQGEFLADRYILGTCPKCKFEEAYGDQCEKCGSSLSPDELLLPRSALSGEKPILKKTTHWYLPLDKYEEFLKKWILEGKKNSWKNNVYGQVKSWLQEGLKPRAVTRDLDWGVEVPLPGAKGKVLYVWFDAPIGYISATKEWAKEKGKDWELYWKNNETSLIHFIGKDNIVFHCIIFPAMLKAHGEYILPENVPANEFLNLEGKKISTSRNWAIWLDEYLKDFPEKEDILRYCLIANMPENKDHNFSWKDFQHHANSELVGILGNFINRTFVLTQKYAKEEVPVINRNKLNKEDLEILEEIKKYPALIGNWIENYHFRDALMEFINLARLGNKYLAQREPWKIPIEKVEEIHCILYVSLQIAGMITQMAEPFLPMTSKKLFKMLNLDPRSWEEITKGEILKGGHLLGKSKLLFEKISNESIDKQLEKLYTSSAEISKREMLPEITFDDFNQIKLCVGTIKEAEKILSTKKLLKLKIDIGSEIRTIVSGIAEHFLLNELTGKQVVVVTNLAKKKIQGVESQGMILLAEGKDGNLTFISPEKNLENGTPIS